MRGGGRLVPCGDGRGGGGECGLPLVVLIAAPLLLFPLHGDVLQQLGPFNGARAGEAAHAPVQRLERILHALVKVEPLQYHPL
jgi:hypothetical protein